MTQLTASTTLRLGLEWFLNPDHIPFLIAQHKRWDREHGFTLELVEPNHHAEPFERLASQDIDILITEPIHLLEERAQGASIIGFDRFLHTNGGVMYFSGDTIGRPRDLVGKRIQYPGAPGPTGIAIAKTMAQMDGAPEINMHFEAVNEGFHHTQALIQNKADAATLCFYNFEIIEARSLGYPAQYFALKEWGVPDFCQLNLATTHSVLTSKGTSIQALRTVLRRAIAFMKEEPRATKDLATQLLKIQSPLEHKILDATLQCFVYDFNLSEYYFSRLGDWMLQHNLIQQEVPFTALWLHENE